MKEEEYNEQMTVGMMINILKHIPSDVRMGMMNKDGKLTSNIHIHYEDTDINEIVLMTTKPLHQMTEEEIKKHLE